MSQLFHTFLYQPLFNLLVILYTSVPGHDIGVAIVILTLLIKLVLYPLTKKTLDAQKKMQVLQPKLKEVQEKYKHDKAVQAQETMKVYQDHGVHPLGGCLPLLVQIPLLLALFQVFRTGFDAAALSNLYSFVQNPGIINPWFLGFLNLSQKSTILAILAGAFQFFHTYLISGVKTIPSSNDLGSVMQKQTLFMMPALTFIISLSLPAALPLYWVANTLFSIGEHYLPSKMNNRRSP